MYDLNHIYKVGNLISKLREEKGLSQSELGSYIEVTNKAVSRWENGRGYPDTSILLKLAEVLEITVDELLKGELSISKTKHKVINKNINYEAEKTLFLRFLTTIIPFLSYIMWITFFFVDPFEFANHLSYGEMFFIGLILPSILSAIFNLILGLFFTLQIHKRKDIKTSVKVLICIATFIGFGVYYIAIFIYMLVRLVKARKNKIEY